MGVAKKEITFVLCGCCEQSSRFLGERVVATSSILWRVMRFLLQCTLRLRGGGVFVCHHNTKSWERPCLALMHTTLTHVRCSKRCREPLGTMQLNVPERAVTGDTLPSTRNALLTEKGKLKPEPGILNVGAVSASSGCMGLRLGTLRLV